MTTADTTDFADLRLAGYLCFTVYSANLAFGRAYRPILDALGVTYPQYIALIALWEQDGQTVTELGEKLFLESNTLTPLLKKLEAAGYLRRERGLADERQVRVSLTPEGRALREKGFSMNLINACGLEPGEFKPLQQAIAKVRDNLVATMARDAEPVPAV